MPDSVYTQQPVFVPETDAVICLVKKDVVEIGNFSPARYRQSIVFSAG